MGCRFFCDRKLKTLRPHPATQILVWISLAIAVQTLRPLLLPVCTGVLIVIAFKIHAQRFFSLLRRSRWILFSLLLVYAFATPGQELWPWSYAPTLEGVQDGGVQLCRLVSMLAGLSVLLTLLPREQLIGGLYSLAYPLRFVGLSSERLAVRLALTLHYAESAMRDTANDWRGAIGRAVAGGNAEVCTIEVHRQPLARMDVLWLLLSAALLVWTAR